MRPPSQGWRTFLRNHASDIAAMDLFVVSTIGFDLLYALVIVRLARRDLVWINVTTHPTADWIAHPRQAHRPRLALAERLRRDIAHCAQLASSGLADHGRCRSNGLQ